jgi:hypothetical protein
MSEYTHYTGSEPIFGLGYPAEGETGTPHDEGVKTEAIGRIMGAMLGALGVGIYRGGVGSIVGADLVISEMGWVEGEVTVPGAVIEDDLGAVPVYSAEETLAAAGFAEGINYVHVQVGATAREDQGCGYYIDGSATPAPDALLVCKVTVAGGVVTAVDNSVRAAPAIAGRIPWAALVRVFGGDQSLEAFLTAALGANYLATVPPASVDSRLVLLEAYMGGGGGGGGEFGAVYWWLLALSPTDATTIPQWVQTITDALAVRLDALEAAGSGSSGAAVVQMVLPDDVANQAILMMTGAHYLPDLPTAQRNTATVVENHYGRGDGADGKDFVGAGSDE